VGVFILRVEPQQDYLLITVTINRHVGRDIASAHPYRTARFADRADALHAAQQFLDSFQ
jgi:hypothetical protein